MFITCISVFITSPPGNLGFVTEDSAGRVNAVLTNDVLSLFDDDNTSVIGRAMIVSRL